MSVTALLDRMGALLPKYFVIAAFMPILIFGFLNALICCFAVPGFRVGSLTQIGQNPPLFLMTVSLVGMAVAAYLLSSVSVFLRDVLEGKRILRFQWLRRSQQVRFGRVEGEYVGAIARSRDISNNKSKWINELKTANNSGIGVTTPFVITASTSASAIQDLKDKRRARTAIYESDLQPAVTELKQDLSKHSSKANPGLRDLWTDMVTLIDEVEQYWQAQTLIAINDLAKFGIGEAAPTEMGNLAASLQAYGLTRYGIDVDTFWSRFQPILANNKEYFANLQDSKAQLDFLIACCWLSAATTACWDVALIILKASPYLFLTIAIIGAIACRLFYALAVESHAVFGQLVRTGIDLYRFQLFEALHIEMPHGRRDERALWAALRNVSAFGQEQADISYHFDVGAGDK